MVTFVIATRNAHKVSEIRSILGAGFRCLDLNSFPGAPNVVEDAPTFAGNSTKKAEALAAWIVAESGSAMDLEGSVFVLADDSGLEVDALQGAPGVHSARFAALETSHQGNSRDEDNNAKLLRLLKDTPRERRTARFRCVVALTPVMRTQEQVASGFENRTHLFDGACEGWIRFEPAGQGGFGYDPLFVPLGYAETFAQLGEEVKNRLSHRSKALAQLKSWFTRANLAPGSP
jgi:XTP/dITP diphosphohydrolase